MVSENRLTPVPASIDARSAPLLGCAVTTALGVINNDAQVAIGESVVVFGLGGIGLNVVQFAAMVGANPVIAVDRLDNKLAMARQFGATHAINSETSKDVAADIRALVGADGADKVIETTGVKHLIEPGYDLTRKRGAASWSACRAKRSRSIRCRSTSKRY